MHGRDGLYSQIGTVFRSQTKNTAPSCIVDVWYITRILHGANVHKTTKISNHPYLDVGHLYCTKRQLIWDHIFYFTLEVFASCPCVLPELKLSRFSLNTRPLRSVESHCTLLWCLLQVRVGFSSSKTDIAQGWTPHWKPKWCVCHYEIKPLINGNL